ncbi:MAG TPA: thymidine phosphorylase [Stellaceae bacterium]|nr:thymidine phosphorylase [Stellaceae bacterium]
MPRIREVIAAKRDGQELAANDIRFFVAGLTDGSISEGQVAAFAMAVLLRGMSLGERVALTRAMTASGTVLDWSTADLGRPVLDKHSTGGVGDKVSLMLAPMVAAAGGAVPMLSGRGLGHTGGTLDKLDSIPGYQSTPDLDRLRRVVREIGCAIIGQTAELAPADRRFYAIRDTTSTVESIPLITASILSKKLAAGLDGLVMDVKVGSGAFMPTLALATELAESIATVAGGAGLPTTALITDMDQVLGTTAGNALEVVEAIDYLTGRARDARLDRVTRELAAEMILLGGLASDLADAHMRIAATLDSGAAAELFQKMVAALGGPGDLLDRPARHLAQAPLRRPVFPPRPGIVAAIDVKAVGLAIVALGGGRSRPEDAVDPAVGLTDVAALGAPVGPDRPLAMVHARDEDGFAEAAARIEKAYRIAEEAPLASPLLRAQFAGAKKSVRD